jgi:hypothetical protein
MAESKVVLTYGPSGVGKTVDQGFGFPRALFAAAPGALNSIQHVCGYMPATAPAVTIEDATKLIKDVAGKYDWLVIDDFSFMAEQTFSRLERKFTGFKMWGKLRDAALEFRDTARFSKVSVVMNCFSRDTEFITAGGVFSFWSFEEGDRVRVMTHTGAWKSARVRHYGKRAMNRITFRRGPARHEVVATPDHRWLLHDGSETTSLKVGDRLLGAPPVFGEWAWEDADEAQRWSWVHGFVFGDGSTSKRGYTSVRLCGGKAAFVERFEELGATVTYPPSLDGDPLVYFGKKVKKSLPSSWSTLPVRGGVDQIQAFVGGYLAADGHHNKNVKARGYAPFTGIQTSDPDAAQFIRRCFPVAGTYLVSETRVDRETNFGHNKADWFTLMQGQSEHHVASFYVHSVEESAEEEAWCLEVEDDHSFVLPFGLPTGNCWEQSAKTQGNGTRVRGGPRLSGNLPEQIPAMCDIVLRAVHDLHRQPWPAVYHCKLDPSWVMKDRFNVATAAHPAPMNLAEIIRASGTEIPRHPDLPDQEELVAALAGHFGGLGGFAAATANEFYTKLREGGMSPLVAKWTLRDALDRAEIQRALRAAEDTFINTSNPALL